MKLSELKKLCEEASEESGMLIIHGDPRSKLLDAARTMFPKLISVAEAAMNPDLIDSGFTGEHCPEAMEKLRSAIEALERE